MFLWSNKGIYTLPFLPALTHITYSNILYESYVLTDFFIILLVPSTFGSIDEGSVYKVDGSTSVSHGTTCTGTHFTD